MVVAPYLMAPGFFFSRLAGCGADVVARPLLDADAPDERLVDLVLHRYRQAPSPPADGK